MKRRDLKNMILSAFVFLCMSAWCGCTREKQRICGQECLQEILQSRWPAFAGKFGRDNIGVALYVKTAGGAYFASYGFTQPFTRQTHFRGASTTKSFTGAAILQLYQQGKLDIDDKITDDIPGTTRPYIPDSPAYAIPYKQDITIRMLLSHRAGVFDVTNSPVPDSVAAPYAGQFYTDYIYGKYGGDHNFTKTELLKPVVEHHLQYFSPGTGFHYSNTGFGLLGLIVENVSGMPLETYQARYLLQAAGLQHSFLAVSAAQSVVPAPKTDYYLNVNNEVEADLFDNLSAAQGDGNIITTIEDLGNWAYKLWGTNKILEPAALKEMTTMIPTGEEHEYYGLACEGGPPEIGCGHNGARVGTMVVMRYDPLSKASFTVATNILDADDIWAQGDVLTDIIKAAQQKMR